MSQVALGEKPSAGPHTVFAATRAGRFAIGTLEKGRVEHFQVDYVVLAYISYGHRERKRQQ